MNNYKAASEHAHQATLVSWFKREYPDLRIFSIPNGTHLAGTKEQRAKQVAKLKMEGLGVGVSDLMVPVARGKHHGLFIEMKKVSGSSTSKEQKDWIIFFNAQGYRAEVCKGWESARDLIVEYLSGEM